MKRIIRLTESDLTRIVKRVIMEQGEEVKKISEVTLSAWLPFDAAKKRASNKGGNILIYFYNDGCKYCENFTKSIMSNETIRKKIVENNLTLCKIVMCVKKGRFKNEEGEEIPYTTCDDSQKELWNRFAERTGGTVPSMLIVDSSGDKVKAKDDGNTGDAQYMALSLMDKIYK